VIKAQRTLMPGAPGTKSMVEKYGDKLVCVRYRVDPGSSKRFKTVELIEHEAEWIQKRNLIPANKIMGIQVRADERYLRRLIKEAGGHWDPQHLVWRLSYRMIKNLGLESRILIEK
jgi:hypothetical protein